MQTKAQNAITDDKPLLTIKFCMIFSLNFVEESKSVEGGTNPLAGDPIRGGSKSAGTPASLSKINISFKIAHIFSNFLPKPLSLNN